jgi:hypothetical protein
MMKTHIKRRGDSGGLSRGNIILIRLFVIWILLSWFFTHQQILTFILKNMYETMMIRVLLIKPKQVLTTIETRHFCSQKAANQ